MAPTGADSPALRQTSEFGWRHRTSEEFALHAPELDEALAREEDSVIHYAWSTQRNARVFGALALGAFGVIATRPESAWWMVLTTIAYLGSIWLSGRVIRTEVKSRAVHRRAMRALLGADATALTIMAVLAGADALALIPAIGVLLVSVAAFYLGQRDGAMTGFLVLGGYGVATMVARFADSVPPSWITSVVTLATFGMVSIAANRVFGKFRRRIDALRMYCKLGELGETTTGIVMDSPRLADDLTALAGSFDAMRARLAEQVGSDPLTGCANRRTLQRQLLADWRLARRQNTTIAVAAVDIDHFKVINDTHGHPVGDLVLQQIASIMLSNARDTDTVARLGGDEFVILLPDSEAGGAVAFAERLREAVQAFSFGSPTVPLHVTISIGVAIAAGVAPLEPDQLMADADRFLYRAKTEGRNRVCTA